MAKKRTDKSKVTKFLPTLPEPKTIWEWLKARYENIVEVYSRTQKRSKELFSSWKK